MALKLNSVNSKKKKKKNAFLNDVWDLKKKN